MPDFEISTDIERIDLTMVYDFLASSYWARGRSRAAVEESIQNSLFFSGHLEKRQVAFARVVTDCSTFAYLADVFVLPEYRNRGFSKRLIAAVLGHSKLQDLRFLLQTRDAHGLYRQFGFERSTEPDRFMVMVNKSNPRS